MLEFHACLVAAASSNFTDVNNKDEDVGNGELRFWVLGLPQSINKIITATTTFIFTTSAIGIAFPITNEATNINRVSSVGKGSSVGKSNLK